MPNPFNAVQNSVKAKAFNGYSRTKKVNEPEKPNPTVQKDTGKIDSKFRPDIKQEDTRRVRFNRKAVEEQEFIERNPQLQGNKNVAEGYLEDEPIKFIKDTEYVKKKAGASTYNSGGLGSGEGDALQPNKVYSKGRGRFTSLSDPSPYKIRLGKDVKLKA